MALEGVLQTSPCIALLCSNVCNMSPNKIVNEDHLPILFSKYFIEKTLSFKCHFVGFGIIHIKHIKHDKLENLHKLAL